MQHLINSNSSLPSSVQSCSLSVTSRGRGQGRGVARGCERASRCKSTRGCGTRRGQSTSAQEGAGQVSIDWTWTANSTPSTAVEIPFTGNTPGPCGIANGVTDPLKFFHLFLPPFLL